MISKMMPSAVLISLFLFGAGTGGAWAETLYVQFPNEPTQYDPLLMEDGISMKFAANVLGHLHEYDGAGVLQKSLVSQWKVSRDQKKIEIEFKKGLKWSDGVEFQPQHFLLALERIRDEPVRVATSQFFPAVDFEKTKIEGLNLRLVLREPDGGLAQWTTLSAMAPIRPDLVQAYQKRAQPNMPTLGAYQVVEYRREDYVHLRRNPFFWDKNDAMPEEVRIRFIKDDSNLVSLLKAGSLDLLFRVPVLQQEEIKKIGRLVSVPVEAVTYLGFNTKKPPFDQKQNRTRFRDAAYHSLSELARILKTDEIPARFFAPDILWRAHPPKRATPPIPVHGEEQIAFEMQSDVNPRNQTILEWIQNVLKRDLGWKSKLDLQEWKSHYARIKVDPKEVYRFGWQNPVSDPYLTYQVLGKSSTNNFTSWSSAEYDELLSRLRQESRWVKKTEIMKQLEDVIWKEAPIVPLLHQVQKFGVSKRVQRFRANSFGVVHFREIRLQ